MSIDLGVLVVSASAPSGYIKTDAEGSDWIWLNPNNGELKAYNSVSGQFDIAISVASHLHPTLGDINFIGTISVGGVAGLNLNTQDEIKKITNLVIVNGIITQFEYEV